MSRTLLIYTGIEII